MDLVFVLFFYNKYILQKREFVYKRAGIKKSTTSKSPKELDWKLETALTKCERSLVDACVNLVIDYHDLLLIYAATQPCGI